LSLGCAAPVIIPVATDIGALGSGSGSNFLAGIVEACVSDRIRASLPEHLDGLAADMSAILDLGP
jgi:hypothetical protein